MDRKHEVSKVLYEKKQFKNLKEIINNTKELYGDRPAFKYKTETPDVYDEMTYNDYIDEINALGTALISVGLKGKRIGIIGENRYEWEEAYLAFACGVGIVVPLDKALPDNEIISLVQRSGIEAIFYSEKYDDVMDKVKADKIGKIQYYITMDAKETKNNLYSQKELVALGKSLIKNGAKSYLDAQIDENEMGIMLFTSGTTSMSKAVMLSHKNICNNINDIRKIIDYDENDVFLSFLPLHHTFESTVGFLCPLAGGSCICFCEGLRHIAENLKDYHVSVMIAVPILFETMYKQLMKGIQKKGKMGKVKFGLGLTKMLSKVGIDIRRSTFKEILENLGGNLRLLVGGGAAFDPEAEKGLSSFGVEVYQGYGLTETSPVIAAEHKGCYNPGSIGKLLPSWEGKILDPNEQGIGELAVKGDSVMLGYYENEEANKEVFTEDGFFRTGDLAYFDKNDFIFITGRQKNVIVLKNGKNVFPEEIETLINGIDGVKESFVYGKPEEDDKDDLKVCAKIVYDKDILEKQGFTNEDAIKEKIWAEIKEVNKKMPTYKYVKEISITTEELTKTTTLKVKRFEEIKKV